MLPRNVPTDDQITQARMVLGIRPSSAVVLMHLALNPGVKFSNQELYELIQSDADDVGQTVAQVIRRARLRLGDIGVRAQIRTLYSSGYWIDAKSARAVLERLG